MPKSHEIFLRHIHDEIEFLQSLPRFSDGTSLRNDPVQSRAAVRSLEIIGEAASKIYTDFRARHDTIPWRRIIALRNRLIHDYMGINFNIVVNVLHNEIPSLAEQLKSLQGGDEQSETASE